MLQQRYGGSYVRKDANAGRVVMTNRDHSQKFQETRYPDHGTSPLELCMTVHYTQIYLWNFAGQPTVLQVQNARPRLAPSVVGHARNYEADPHEVRRNGIF